MKAGRELDALVAEKVMGWERGNERRGDHGWWVADESRRSGKRLRAFLPRYSESIDCAWAVVEKLEADGFTVEYRTHGVRDGRRVVVMDRADAGRIKGHGEADTAPMAICLAALRAVGVEVPDGA